MGSYQADTLTKEGLYKAHVGGIRTIEGLCKASMGETTHINLR